MSDWSSDGCSSDLDDRQLAKRLNAVAHLAREANLDREAGEPLDLLADLLAAHRCRGGGLNVFDREAVACSHQAVDRDIDVAAAGDAVRDRRGRSFNILHHLRYLAAPAVQRRQIGPGDLPAARGLCAGWTEK